MAPGTVESTFANTIGNSRNTQAPDNLQAKVDLMLQDIMIANAERAREHQEKLEAQR